MGFDMDIIKVKKKTLEDILQKYYQKDINDLPYEAFEELEKESSSKSFTSRVDILRNIENKLPYANCTYVYLDKEQYELILSHCSERKAYLMQYAENDFYGKELEYRECERLYYWLQGLNPDWDNELIIYEHDC